MNDEEEDWDEEHEHHPHPDRGVYNPLWVFKAVLMSSRPLMRWNGLAGLADYFSQTEPNECFSADEVIDVIIQYMYTGEYVNPFLHAYPGEEGDPITEAEIKTFTDKLDFFGKDGYTDDEDTD